MESDFEFELKQKNILARYEYLEFINKYYQSADEKESLSLENCLVNISRTITELKKDSNTTDVEKVKKFFLILVKNSIRLDKNTIIFKALSYFIPEGFDIFISILKDKNKSTSFKKFNSLLLKTLNSKNIGDAFQINKNEVEKSLNLTQFRKVVEKMQSVNKNIYFVLLFFRKFVEEKDQIIHEEIKKFIKDREIKRFYDMFDEEILIYKNNKDEKTKGNEIENKEGENIIEVKEKNEIKEDCSNHLIQNTDDSSNLEKKNSGSQEFDSNDSSLIKINEPKQEENCIYVKDNNIANNNDILSLIHNLTKEIENLKKNEESSMKEIECLKKKEESTMKEIECLKKNDDEKNERIILLDKNIIELKNEIKLLDKKLNLSLLINNLVSQRDTYKKSLEILLNYAISKYELKIALPEGDPLWKNAKLICKKILELKEKTGIENNKKLVNGLTSLLFCKDYINCIVHGKGKLSGEINQLFQKSERIPFISVASYENMRDSTMKFFGSIVNELEEFKLINSLLQEKIKNWNDQEDFDYTRYFAPNGIQCDLLIGDFKIVVDIMDKLKLSVDVDSALEN